MRLRGSPLRFEGEWDWNSREARECIDRSRLQLAPLRARDSRDERQMIVGAPLRRAVGAPMTDLTGLDRLRIVVDHHAFVSERDCLDHLPANHAEVCRI